MLVSIIMLIKENKISKVGKVIKLTKANTSD